MASNALFRKEEKVIEEGKAVLSDEKNQTSPLFDNYSELLSDYKKIFKQVKRLVKMSDKQHQRLNEALEQVKVAREALWGEMQLAKKIQTTLLPVEPKINGYELTGYMEPADEVGGDYYDIITGPDKNWLVIGDVSGHGVVSGLVMMMAQTSINTVLAQTPDISPSQLLSTLNRTLRKNIGLLQEDKYMTMTVLSLNTNGDIQFSGLHQDILVYRNQNRTIESINTDGMWMGILDDLEGMLPDHSFTLNTGDTMLLYTDGVTEAMDKDGAMYSDERLISLFEEHGSEPVETIKDAIIGDLETFSKPDDVTFVLLKRLF